MPTLTIAVSGVASAMGAQLTISGTWTGLTSIALTIECVDGSGAPQIISIPGGGNPPVVLNANGTFSVTVDTACACGKQYRIEALGYVQDALAVQASETAVLECEAPASCCPEPGSITMAFAQGLCGADCRRAMAITISYQGAAKPGCPSTAFMDLTLFDPGNVPAAGWPPFAFPLAGPFQKTVPVTLAPGVGYKAVVQVIVGGEACAPVEKLFEVLPCETPPPCPSGLTLSGIDLGCDGATGACLSTAQFVIGGTFGEGCGSVAATKLALDFGDGGSTLISVPGAGFQQFVKTHAYASGGTKTAQLTVLHPTGCSPSTISASVDLKACTPADCIECPDPPPPPWWCFCKSCWLYSRKPGKGICKFLMLLMFVVISSATLGILQGWTTISLALTWQNIAAVAAMFGTTFFLLYYSKWCGNCCAACAIWPGIVIGIVASLILWYYGYGPTGGPIQWVLSLIVVLLAAILLYAYFNSECQTEKANELSDENWCK